MKKLSLKDFLWIALSLFALVWLFRKLDKLPSWKDVFATRPLQIDQTPILVKEIKSIAQLVTVTALDEVVVDSVVYNKISAFAIAFNMAARVPVLPTVQKQIVLICKGRVLAGINLQKLAEKDISIKNDTAIIRLPPAQILDVIVNPGDFETFVETGVWTPEALTTVKIKARQKITDRALSRGILKTADAKARTVIENFFRTAGYKTVQIATTTQQ